MFFFSPEDVWSQGRRKVQIFGGKRATKYQGYSSNHSMVGFVTSSFTGRQNNLYLSVLYLPQASTRVMIKQKITSHTHQGIYDAHIEKAPKFARYFYTKIHMLTSVMFSWEGLVPICQSCYQGISSKAGEGHESGNGFPLCNGPLWSK